MGILSKFNGPKGSHLTLELSIGEFDVDIKSNSSKVRIWGTLITSPYASFYGGARTITITVDGKSETFDKSFNIGANQRLDFVVKEYTIKHNSDGGKPLDYSLKIDTGIAIFGSASASGRYNLTKIPIADSFTVSDGELGKPIEILIAKQQEAYKHNVKWFSGSQSGSIANGVDTEARFTPSLDLANNFPTANEVPVTITVETLSDGTVLGSNSSNVSIKIPDSVKPTLAGSEFKETAPIVTKVWPQGIAKDTFIQILSDIKAIPKDPRGAYGSTVTEYRSEIVGENAVVTGLSGGYFGTLNYSGLLSVDSYVIDSRGRKSEVKRQTIEVLGYRPPSLSFNVTRSGSDLSTLTVSRNAAVSPLSIGGKQNNEMVLSFRAAKTGEPLQANANGAGGSWLSIASLVNSNANLSGSFPANQTYDVEATLSDKFLSTTFRASVATEQFPFSWDKDGIGIGKPKQKGALDVKGDEYIEGKLDVTGTYLRSGNPIQNHPLTNTDGSLIYKNAANGLDEIKKTGFYNVQGNSVGNPFGKQSMLATYQIGDNLIQDITSISGDKASRYYDTSQKAWSSWTKYLKQNEEIKTTSIVLPYQLRGTLTKSGNMAYLTVNKSTASLGKGENMYANEHIPQGFLPYTDFAIGLTASSNSSILGYAVMQFTSDSGIYTTNNFTGFAAWSGTAAYILKPNQ